MSRPRNEDELQRIHIWLKIDHVEFIKENYGDTLGFSKAIQAILGKFIGEMRASVAQHARSIKLPDGLLEDLQRKE